LENLNSPSGRTEEEIRKANLAMFRQEEQMRRQAEKDGKCFFYLCEEPVIREHEYNEDGICTYCRKSKLETEL